MTLLVSCRTGYIPLDIEEIGEPSGAGAGGASETSETVGASVESAVQTSAGGSAGAGGLNASSGSGSSGSGGAGGSSQVSTSNGTGGSSTTSSTIGTGTAGTGGSSATTGSNATSGSGGAGGSSLTTNSSGTTGSGGTGSTGSSSAYSLAYDGATEFVSVGDFTLASGSISLWIKTSSLGSQYLVSKVLAGGSVRGEFRLFLENGQIVQRTESPTVNEIRSDGAVADGQWHHVVATFNPGLTLFVDGVQQADVNSENRIGIDLSGVVLELGRNNGLFDSYFAGLMDEVAFYDIQLSAAQVTEVYNTGVPAGLSTLSSGGSLVHWWRCGDGDTAPTLLDAAGSENGSMTNMDATNFSSDTP